MEVWTQWYPYVRSGPYKKTNLFFSAQYIYRFRRRKIIEGETFSHHFPKPSVLLSLVSRSNICPGVHLNSDWNGNKSTAIGVRLVTSKVFYKPTFEIPLFLAADSKLFMCYILNDFFQNCSLYYGTLLFNNSWHHSSVFEISRLRYRQSAKCEKNCS